MKVQGRVVFRLTCMLPVCEERGSSYKRSPSTLRSVLRIRQLEADKGCARMDGRTLPLRKKPKTAFVCGPAILALDLATQGGRRIAAIAFQHTHEPIIVITLRIIGEEPVDPLLQRNCQRGNGCLPSGPMHSGEMVPLPNPHLPPLIYPPSSSWHSWRPSRATPPCPSYPAHPPAAAPQSRHAASPAPPISSWPGRARACP